MSGGSWAACSCSGIGFLSGFFTQLNGWLSDLSGAAEHRLPLALGMRA
jgi:hypothetical protein